MDRVAFYPLPHQQNKHSTLRCYQFRRLETRDKRAMRKTRWLLHRLAIEAREDSEGYEFSLRANCFWRYDDRNMPLPDDFPTLANECQTKPFRHVFFDYWMRIESKNAQKFSQQIEVEGFVQNEVSSHKISYRTESVPFATRGCLLWNAWSS